MIRKISGLLALSMIFGLMLSFIMGFSVFAEEEIQSGDMGDGFTWEYDSSTNTLTISGEGIMPDVDEERYRAGEYWYGLIPDQRLETLVVSDGVTEISDFFQQHYTVNTMIIGTNLSSDKGISRMVKESFVLDEDNDYFTLYDGVLYSENGTKLVSCPRDKTTIDFKDGITEIGDYAFYRSNLGEAMRIEGPDGEYYQANRVLVIPWGVTTLGESVFQFSYSSSTGGIRLILPDTIFNLNNSLYNSDWSTVSYTISQNNQALDDIVEEMRAMMDRVGPTGSDDGWLTVLDSVAEYYPDVVQTGLVYENGKAHIYDDNGNMLRSGWYEADGDWFYLNDYGAGVVSCWRLGTDGEYRYLKSDGTMAHDEWILDYNNWYYLTSDGTRYESTWARTGGSWYWFGGSGKMMSNGWLRLADGYWYYFNPSGAMATGWKYVGGKWYYLTGSGAMAANRWVQTGGLWYYVGSDGAMLTSTTTPDGYYVNADGVWVS